MVEETKAGTSRARKRAPASKKAPEAVIEPVVAGTAAVENGLDDAPTLPLIEAAQPRPRRRRPEASLAEPMQFSRLGQQDAEAVRHAMSQAAAVTARGTLEINEKILAALQTHGHAVLDFWHSALTVQNPSELLRLQAAGTRQVCETASAQWKDIAETTARWFSRSLEPLNAVLPTRVQ